MAVNVEPANSLTSGSEIRRRLVVLILFGIVAGYVEAAAVVYIRASYEPIHQRLFPDAAPDDLFPLANLEEWSREVPPHLKTPVMEMTREVGTVLLVALVALGVSRGATQWFASFVLTFGVWDLTYYLWLRLLMGWPHSLLDWDLIFAVPIPWVGPVLAPVLVAATMVVAACVYFRTEALGRPMTPGRGHWFLVLSGGVISLIAFWWDVGNVFAGKPPNPFNWPVLLLGLAVGMVGFGHALFARRRRDHPI